MAGAASSRSGAGGATQAACGTAPACAEESGEPVGDHGLPRGTPRVGGGTPVGAVDNDTESGTGRAAG